MRDCLLKQFDATELPWHVADLLERAYVVARGTESVIRAVRVRAVQCSHGESADLSATDADFLMGLAQASSELLGDRLEALSQHVNDESRRLSDDEHSLGGNS
ncbi:hypothetical protein PSP6_10144 [Paraburkholderia tropica]|uniref:hypothetical protein n=1 Tax=Paraburkholderia tropica TaxID=92647 RepID=UPI001CAF3A90|nr:hypothetical protein [Paraburkholderia tropica]CAG9189517.1 hypothetical protein PSP6_10144 [Paraburkholderia tropica]